MRWTWIIIGVLVAAGIGGLVAAQMLHREPIEAARIVRGEIRQYVDERAVTRLPKVYQITMPYDGRINAIELEPNQRVREGQVVAQVVQKDLDAAVEAAQAAVARLDEEIEKNNNSLLEKLAKLQALEFVKSMELTVEAASNRMTASEARKKVARDNFERIKGLVPGGTKTRDDYDQAELEKVQAEVDHREAVLVWRISQAFAAATNILPQMIDQYVADKQLSAAVLKQQRAEADANLRMARLRKQRGEMKSPVSGIVLERHVSNERNVAAGTVLLEIGDLSRLEVEAEVLSTDVSAIDSVEPGGSAGSNPTAPTADEVEIYGPAVGRPEPTGKPNAVVKRVDRAGFTKVSSRGVEQQRVRVVIEFKRGVLAELLQRHKLGLGYRVRARIYSDRRAAALIAPRTAIFRTDTDQWGVFVIKDGRTAKRRVKVGMMNDSQVEITEGLKEGDLVVRSPEGNLNGGARVDAVLREE